MKKLFENWRRYAKLTEATFAGAQEKIKKDKEPFFVVSAFRNERGSMYSRGNWSAASALKEFFLQKGLSYTIVEGGYTEKVRKDGEVVKIMNDEGDFVDKTESIIEESYLVFGNVPHYGDESAAIQDIQALFEIAKEACLVDKENPQESFSFGYPRTIEDPVEGTTKKEMFIALYLNNAPAPGPANAYTQWGGPWNSYEEFMADEGAYTKVRGTKGTFANKKIKEAMSGSAKSVTDGNRRQAKVKYWTKMKNRWLAENRRKRETGK